MYVSLDAGKSWRSFQQNLPVTPITDMVIHRDDLVVSTMGRSFWILDDISAMRGLKGVDVSIATLLPPRATVRTRLRGAGATLHYILPEDTSGLQIEIRDLSKQKPELIRTIKASNRRPSSGRRDQGMRSPFRRGGGGGGRALSMSKGFHRYTWDMRRDGVSGRGPMVAAGTYEICLVHANGVSTQRLTLTMDPRVAAEGITAEDLQAQADLILEMQALSAKTSKLVADVRRMSRAGMSKKRGEQLDAIRAKLINASITYPQRMLQAQVGYLSSMLDRADQRPGDDAYARMKQLKAEVAAVAAELEALQ
jgi:hypothetical protein